MIAASQLGRPNFRLGAAAAGVAGERSAMVLSANIMSSQRLGTAEGLGAATAVSERRAAVSGFHGKSLRSRRVWLVCGCIGTVLAAVVWPSEQLLQAMAGKPSDGWEIELVPRSSAAFAQPKSPDPELGTDDQKTAPAPASASMPVDPGTDTASRTPDDRRWARVESEAELSERAEPLNAIRRSASPSRQSVHTARPLNAVAAQQPGKLEAGKSAAMRTVSSTRSTGGARGSASTAAVPVARLKTPNFARRGPAAATAEPVEEPAQESAPAHPSVVQGGLVQPRAWPSAAGPSSERAGATARNGSRTFAGELPRAVRPEERAEPLRANSGRSAAMSAVAKRSPRQTQEVVMSESPADPVSVPADPEPTGAASAAQVTAPDPKHSVADRPLGPRTSMPLAGHSLFVDPFPLVPTFTGSSPAYPPRSQQPTGAGSRGVRPGAGGVYAPQQHVIPQRAIPHTGWYGASPGVRSISHSEPQPTVLPGHSLLNGGERQGAHSPGDFSVVRE
jgi:hypothetical protein